MPRAGKNGILLNMEDPPIHRRKPLRPDKKCRLCQTGPDTPKGVEGSRDVNLLLCEHYPWWKKLADVRLCACVNDEEQIEQLTACAPADVGDPIKVAGRESAYHHRCSNHSTTTGGRGHAGSSADPTRDLHTIHTQGEGPHIRFNDDTAAPPLGSCHR